jgi:predicted phage terminase large subunit-like protein
MVRGKWEADELRQQVKLCWQKWSKFKLPPYGFYIEDKSSGIGVIQEIKKTDPIPIIPITRARYKNDQGMWVAADKFSRVMTTAPYLANGWVYLPNGEKDCISAPLLAECAAFRADLSHKHDDMCFVDMTIIATNKGKKKISDVCIGDKVLTPFGYSKVLATSKRAAEVITNISLTGTPDHKVFNKYDYNFDKLKNMTYSQVSKLTFKDMFEWKKQIVFNSMARNIIVASRKDIFQLATITKTRKVEQDFTEMFGSFIRARKYRKAIIFTIKMGIGLIMIFQTLSVYHAKNILKDIGKRLWIFGKDRKCKKQMQEVERNVKSGTQVKKDISGIQSIRKNISNLSCKNKYANRAVKSSEHLQTQDIKQCATNVEIESCTSSLDNQKKIVYNIQTEAGCYYANGILVSNCDTLCDAVDVAFGSTGISSIFI